MDLVLYRSLVPKVTIGSISGINNRLYVLEVRSPDYVFLPCLMAYHLSVRPQSLTRLFKSVIDRRRYMSRQVIS